MTARRAVVELIKRSDRMQIPLVPELRLGRRTRQDVSYLCTCLGVRF